MAQPEIYYRIDKSAGFAVVSPKTLIKHHREDECDCLAIVPDKQRSRQCHKPRARVNGDRVKTSDIANLASHLRSGGALCPQHQKIFDRNGEFQEAYPLIDSSIEAESLPLMKKLSDTVKVLPDLKKEELEAHRIHTEVTDEELDRYIARDPERAAYVSACLKQAAKQEENLLRMTSHGLEKGDEVSAGDAESSPAKNPAYSSLDAIAHWQSERSTRNMRQFSPSLKHAASEDATSASASSASKRDAATTPSESQSMNQKDQSATANAHLSKPLIESAEGADLRAKLRQSDPSSSCNCKCSCRLKESRSQTHQALRSVLEAKLEEFAQNISIAFETTKSMALVHQEIQKLLEDISHIPHSQVNQSDLESY